jgi:colanic acid/amylovoran biosynthesis protein
MGPLEELYERYRETGRICLIGNDKCPNARQLKGYIARCRFFAGARTHAAIAAYSSMVPALVLGYSVKATGIARDIFGSENGLVINVNGMKDDTLLKSAFIELVLNEDKYRGMLKEKMPAYIQSAKDAVLRLRNL